MFCGECGAKNEKGASFCAECGAKLENNEEKETKSSSSKKTSQKKVTRKKMSKKQKVIIIICLVVVVVLFSLYQIGAYLTNPKQIVKEYIEAVESKNYDKIYDYENFTGDTTFVSKDLYETKVKGTLEEIEISNYSVGETTYENEGLTANVKVSMTVTNGEETETGDITFELTKEKDKKYLIYNNWSLDTQEMFNVSLIEDYEISVPKGTEVTYNDIKVSDKYLLDTSTDSTDIYSLPQVLGVNTKVSFKLANGMELSDEVSPSSYYDSYDLEISKNDFSDEEQEKISTAIKNSISSAMEGLSTNKSFDDIKNTFATTKSLDDLKEEYNDSLDTFNDKNYTISNFEITNLNISAISFDDDYNIRINTRINYKYTATSKEDGETDDNTDYDYFYCYLAYEDGEYKLVDIDSFPSVYAYFF